MKTIVLKNPHELVVEEVPEPQIGPDEALIKVAACGICGTDVHIYKHGSLTPNVRIGHESVGTVVEVGKQIEGLRAGDRVAALLRMPCGQCHWCRRGRHHICPTRLDVRGGFSEYIAAKEGMLARIPDNITFKQAAVIEAMAVSLHGLRRAKIDKGDGVVVSGAGPIGLLAAVLLREIGVRGLVVSEPSSRRRETANQWADRVVNPFEEDLAEIARDTLDPCVDVLVECSGHPRVLEEAFSMVGFAGRVLLLAACLENININPALLLVREICFEASYGCDMDEFRHCIELVSSGKVDVNPIISRTISQAEVPEAFERLCGPNDDVKVVMEIP